MAGGKPALFLARAPYRRRRLRDAARLLPILGLVLLLLPLFWTEDPLTGLTSGDVIYFFGVWSFLIAVAAAFAPALSRGDRPIAGPEGAADEEED